jgi:hypothetical protein
MLLISWDSAAKAINRWSDLLNIIEARTDVNPEVFKMLLEIEKDMVATKFDMLSVSKSE